MQYPDSIDLCAIKPHFTPMPKRRPTPREARKVKDILDAFEVPEKFRGKPAPAKKREFGVEKPDAEKPKPIHRVAYAKAKIKEARAAEPDAPKPRKSPRGRPGEYDPEYHPAAAFRFHLLGLTDKELASGFGIDERKIYEWDEKYPEFRQSRARGKEPADANVAERLYKRAIGYSHESVKIFMPAGAEEPVYAPFTEHYPPDTQAISWWLKNRQGKRWKEKSEVAGEFSLVSSLADRISAARKRAPGGGS
jgi:hypothetical protein